MISRTLRTLVCVIGLSVASACANPIDADSARTDTEVEAAVQHLQTLIYFTGCDATQVDAISRAVVDAAGYAERGLSMHQNDPWDDRVMRWFGLPEENMWSVGHILRNTYLSFDWTWGIDIICDPPSPTASCPGFLARAQDQIRICAGYWTLPFTSKIGKSQVSTILHETVHFAGAWDDAGDSNPNLCRENAGVDPRNVWDNAPNYEYYYINEIF